MHSFFARIWNFDFDNPYLKAFDWISAVGTLLYGIWTENTLISIIGILGCAMAWYRPVSRYQRWLKSFVQKR